MTRLTYVATFVVAMAAAAPAFAQQAELAEKLNDDGKELLFAGKFAEATAKFRDAVARVPEPKYFINLCASLYSEGKFDEAMTACNAVAKNNPTPEQTAKTDKMVGRIKDEAAKQHVELHPMGVGGGGGDQNLGTNPGPPGPNGNPTGTPPDPNGNPTGAPPPPPYTPAVGRPPTQAVWAAGPAENNKYTWTLGIDLFAGGGTIGQKDVYGNSATGFRIKGDYLLNAASGVGAQGYITESHYGQGDMQVGGYYTLDIVDVGIAAYKHLCSGSSRLCFTPLAGVQLALMSPNGESDGEGSQLFNYSALGARLELAMQYALGSRMEHVISAGIGTNLYSKVFSESMDVPAEEVGLDKGGAAGYFSIGYTYRFNTPLGSSPFVTLE